MRFHLLPLLGLACSLTIGLSPARSQGAPGEAGEERLTAAHAEEGFYDFNLTDIGEAGVFSRSVAEGVGEAGLTFQLAAEPGETGGMGLHFPQADPGESSPPPAHQH